MKVTNNSKALQGVHTKLGVLYIAPGETADADLTEEGLKGAKRLDFLSVTESKKADTEKK
jgi:hypothetical protein